MSLMKYRTGFDDFWGGWGWLPVDWTTRTIDTTKYNVIDGEIVPRKDHIEALIKKKEEQIKKLQEERDELLRQRD